MRLQKRVVSYEDISIDGNELLMLREAAAMLKLGINSLIGQIDRGNFTEIRDADAVDSGRRYNTRFLLRAEVEEAAAKRVEARQEGDSHN